MVNGVWRGAAAAAPVYNGKKYYDGSFGKSYNDVETVVEQPVYVAKQGELQPNKS